MSCLSSYRPKWSVMPMLLLVFVLQFVPCFVLASPLTEAQEAGLMDAKGELSPLPAAAWQQQQDEQYFELMRQDAPTLGTKQLEQAQKLIQKGEYKAAQQQLETFIKDHAQYAPAHEVLGLVLLLQGATEPAIAALQKAAALDPRSSSALTKLGTVYLNLGQREQAKQVLLKAVELNPKDRFANQRLGLIYEQDGMIEQAISSFEQGIQDTDPQYVGIKVNLGALYNKQQRFPKTIALLSDVLKPESGNVVGHIVLGTAYLASDQIEQAVRHFQYAAKVDNVRSAIPLAVAYRSSGKGEEAKTVLMQALQVRANEPYLLFQLAETCNYQNESQQALEYYQQALNAGYPKLAAWRRIAAVKMRMKEYSAAIDLLRQIITSKESVLADSFVLSEAYQFNGQFDEAEKLLLTLSKRSPQEPLVWYRLGLHYGLTRKYDKAIVPLQHAKSLAAQNAAVVRALALAYYQAGKKDEAIAAAEELYGMQKDSKDSAFFLASLLQGVGKNERALPLYEHIVASPPPHPPSLNNLAELKAKTGALGKALPLARQAVQFDPENSHYLDTLGWILLQMGNLDEALGSLEKAQQLSPSNPTIQFHLGKLYLQKGTMEKGKQFIQASISDPSVPWIEEARHLLSK